MLINLENSSEVESHSYEAILQGLINQSRASLEHFFENFNAIELEEVLKECLDCQGLILLSGVGKSGIVAEKVATTLVSTGTKALFVPPGNFLHGDIGILSQSDILILFSKSGESEDLLDLIPFAKKRGAKVIAVVSREGSKLERGADKAVFLPVLRELGPLDLIPTTSTTVQLIFGDLLTIALMKTKKVTLEDYAANHPEGSIGKKLLLKVEDLMLQGDKIPFCSDDKKVMEVLVELSEKKCGCLIVVDNEKNLKGIFTDGDLRRSLQRFGPSVLDKAVIDLMTTTPITLNKEEMAWSALKIMQQDPKRWIMVAPVLDEALKVVGIIRMHDIIQAGI